MSPINYSSNAIASPIEDKIILLAGIIVACIHANHWISIQLIHIYHTHNCVPLHQNLHIFPTNHSYRRVEFVANMVLFVLLRVIYPPPSNLFVTAMSVISLVSMGNAGIMELKGKHMQYSKLWKISADKKAKISSKTGMIIAYTPAFLAGVSSFVLVPAGELRFDLLRSAITIHFFKRIFEVLFVHKFSGWMDTEAATTISLSYFINSATMIYSHHLIQGIPEPQTDLKYVGSLLFLVGISGNFYHHYLLSKLRTKGDKNYKIPHGGLFNLVICPHYLFEIMGFIGISCISQTLYPFCFTFGSTFYLMGRSYATRRWYQSKFEDFPTHVKALIPYIF